MANMETSGPKVVVIGGGTGTFTVLSGLKHYVQDLSAIVAMSDDGGSSGILRDEMGVLPPGDIRQCLVALSPQSHALRDLLNHRFGSGQFEGHAFGNLLISALEQISGGFEQAVKTAENILNIQGRVIPVTTDNVRLKLNINNQEIIGEKNVINASFSTRDKPRLSLQPKAHINPDVIEAIASADMVVIGPGNLYGSLLPNLLVAGMKDTLVNSPARKVLVCNLVNKPSQTKDFQVHDYVDTIENYAEAGLFDYVVYSNRKPPKKQLAVYAKEGEEWVENNKDEIKKRQTKGIGADLLSRVDSHIQENDNLIDRNLIRHDSNKLARELMKVYFS